MKCKQALTRQQHGVLLQRLADLIWLSSQRAFINLQVVSLDQNPISRKQVSCSRRDIRGRSFSVNTFLWRSFSPTLRTTLLATYTKCTVEFVLCIWPIFSPGAMGSRCVAPKDQIQIFNSAFGQGHWLGIKQMHVLMIVGETRVPGEKPTQTRNIQAAHRKALHTRKLNPGPSCCKAKAVITRPCHQLYENILPFKLLFYTSLCVYFSQAIYVCF